MSDSLAQSTFLSSAGDPCKLHGKGCPIADMSSTERKKKAIYFFFTWCSIKTMNLLQLFFSEKNINFKEKEI